MNSDAGLILAPQGRDAQLARSMLLESGIVSEICDNLTSLVAKLEVGASFAVVTEEAIATADLNPLAEWIARQPQWSDLPFILLTLRGGGLERNPAAGRYLEQLSNVTFIERPFHPTTLISVTKSAIRARRRQYLMRSQLEAISRGEDRMIVALAAGGLGTWALDALTLELEASITCKAHYGRKPDDLLTFGDVRRSVHPDDVVSMEAAMKRSMEAKVDYEVEYRCIWPDGSMHWVTVNGKMERADDGTLIRTVGVTQDVTARRESEEAIRSFAAELEQRVEERTRDHQRISAQLHEAQKLETIGQLTGGVAHDFNNLLTPIMAALDLLQRRVSSVDPSLARLVDTALQAAERARTLVKRLLGFARRTDLHMETVDLVLLIKGIEDLIKSSIGSHIGIEFDLADDLPASVADANQIELALLNLCVNARDAMPDGGQITIAAEIGSVDEARNLALNDAHYVVISVKDTGTGMDEETVRRAIEPFFSTKEVGRGTGLGLSMIHGLAAQLGGAFKLRSAIGNGTVAELWLPASVNDQARPLQGALPHEAAQSTGCPLSILLVDDEPIVRMGTAQLLREMGHSITEASGGHDALNHLKDGLRPDMLVTDLKMPAMDGLELIERVRSMLPGISVLLVTGYWSENEQESNIPRLGKPFGSGELESALASAAVTAFKRIGGDMHVAS